MQCLAATWLLVCVPGQSMAEPDIIAHRGAWGRVPENTIAAFFEAWRQGADGIETDVRLTKDGHIVCYHDPKIRRWLKRDLQIASSTLADIYAARKKIQDSDKNIPVIGDVLKIIPKGKKIYIEIKSGPEIIPVLAKALKRSSLCAKQVVIISFFPEVILEWKKLNPNIKALWLTRYKLEKSKKIRVSTPAALLQKSKKIRADGVSIKAQKAMDGHLVKWLKEQGLEVHVWTVDDKKQAARYKKFGVDSITTNHPGAL